MGLILRTTFTPNPISASYVKGSPLTYAEGDGNFVYLLTNMSGSNIHITGSTSITGSLNFSNISSGTSETRIVVVDNSGNFKYRTDVSL